MLATLLSIEFKDYFRSASTAFWVFVYPFLVLFFLVAIFGNKTMVVSEQVDLQYGAFLLCGMVCINLVSTSLFGFTLPLVENRNKGALKMYHLFPVWTPIYVVAVIVSRVAIATLFNLAFLVISAWILDVHLELSLFGWLSFILLLFVASSAFVVVGLFLASVCDKTSTTTTVTNIIFFPLLILSNVFFPAEALPEFFREMTEYSPLQVTVNSMRAIVLNGDTILSAGKSLAVLVSMTLVFTLLSIRFFKWK